MVLSSVYINLTVYYFLARKSAWEKDCQLNDHLESHEQDLRQEEHLRSCKGTYQEMLAALRCSNLSELAGLNTSCLLAAAHQL